MTSFAPKTYQAQVLESVETYFQACHELPSPSIAYTAATERLWGRGQPYNPLSGFPSEAAVAAIVAAAEISRTTAIEFFQTPAELGERSRIPQLALRMQGELQLFDDPEVLEYPWDLLPYDAAPTVDNLVALGAGLRASEGGEIDVDDASGKVVSRFLPDLQRDLGLAYQPEHWDDVRLATWLCKNLPEEKLTHTSKQAFVAAWLADLLHREAFTMARVNLQKFLIRNLIETRIRDLRKQAVGKAFQHALFGDDAASRVAVSDLHAFDFHPQAYAPSRDYDGRFGHFDFRKHFYGRMGDFDSKEEFECACWLDMQAQKGRIQEGAGLYAAFRVFHHQWVAFAAMRVRCNT